MLISKKLWSNEAKVSRITGVKIQGFRTLYTAQVCASGHEGVKVTAYCKQSYLLLSNLTTTSKMISVFSRIKKCNIWKYKMQVIFKKIFSNQNNNGNSCFVHRLSCVM